MKVLLDECIDESLRNYIDGHLCQTCRYAGFKGLSNGQLIAAAEQASFEVLITVDQSLVYQQSLKGCLISVILLRSPTTNIEDILPLLPEVLRVLESIEPGQVIRIGR